MDWSQVLYVTVLTVALAAAVYRRGWGASLVAVVMVFNLAGTMMFWRDPMAVATVDLLSAVALIAGSGRDRVVGLIFALMPVVYLASEVFGWGPATVYTLADLMAYLQLAIIGGADGGVRTVLRSRRGDVRHRGPRGAVLRQRGDPGVSLEGVPQDDPGRVK